MEKRGARKQKITDKDREGAALLRLSSFHRISRWHRRPRAGQGRSVAVTPRPPPAPHGTEIPPPAGTPGGDRHAEVRGAVRCGTSGAVRGGAER